MPHVYLDSESPSLRDDYFAQVRKGDKITPKFNPFILAGLVFFALLVAFVVMMAIFTLVFLKQGFSGLHGVF